jgi:hypothetical protein
MRRVIALGVESRRQSQNFGWTKLHAETTSLAALDDNGNATFGHDKTPTWGVQGTPNPQKLWRLKSVTGVTGITRSGDVARSGRPQNKAALARKKAIPIFRDRRTLRQL